MRFGEDVDGISKTNIRNQIIRKMKGMQGAKAVKFGTIVRKGEVLGEARIQRSEARSKKQEARDQETGDRRQETGDRRRRTGDKEEKILITDCTEDTDFEEDEQKDTMAAKLE